MNFKQFLTEHTLSSQEEIDTIIKIIKDNCQPFLDQIQSLDLSQHRLYRGMQSYSKYGSRQVHNNRPPVSTDLRVHKIMDEWFLQNVGFRARSEAVFGTGDYDTASLYGTVYSIFPIGEFKFCWSENVSDMYTDYPKPHKEERILQNFLKRSNYQTTDLCGAIKSKKEIMIKCDHYVFVRNDIMNDILFITKGKAL